MRVVVGLQQREPLIRRRLHGLQLGFQAPDMLDLLGDHARARIGFPLQLVLPPVAVGEQTGEVVRGLHGDRLGAGREPVEDGPQCRRLSAQGGERGLVGRVGSVGAGRHTHSFAEGMRSAPAPNGVVMSNDVADR